MQTYKDFLEMMPRDIRWRFLRNVYRDRCVDTEMKIYDVLILFVRYADRDKSLLIFAVISAAFIWSDTIEGKEFWNLVSKEKYDEARKCLEVQNV